eukprot:950248-Ditylum_brightwellii.AAC.1
MTDTCSTSKMRKKSKGKAMEGEWFPFLDMKMKWQQTKLLFHVYKKEGKQSSQMTKLAYIEIRISTRCAY